MTKFVNLYYGADKPLVCGSKTFESLAIAREKGKNSDNYVTTVAYEQKKPSFVAFTIDKYIDLVEYECTHVVKTRLNSLAEIISTEGGADAPVIAIVDGKTRLFKADGTSLQSNCSDLVLVKA